MRIISGRYRGLTLASVGKGDTAAHLRPTSDRVRESLFNLLMSSHDDPAPDARVLDLFAGTGALGLEALSRGANHVTFVDDGAKARALLRENIDKTRSQDATRFFRRDATRIGVNLDDPFDLIFLDPPYGKGFGERAIAASLAGGWLAPDALLVWEENAPQEAPEGFIVTDRREYGGTHITILRAPPAS